ncbi:hypothetical protein Prudu_588S000100 [Prunus dulcis]|uniref:Uncharacterized protein n=1 Tax=Prunus dulcis TaxID=3755 RepID=A0A5H2XYL6_PRUDU|nr:hypothetical protein Prudu_588S000100 [Prunus dulcis]
MTQCGIVITYNNLAIVNCREKIHAMRRGPCKLHLTSQSPMMPNNRKLCPNVGWFWVHNMNNCREWECPSVLEEQESLRSHDVAAAALSAGLLVHWDLEASTPDTYRPPPPPLLMEDFWDFWGFWKMSLWDAREAHVEPLVFTKGNISNPSGYQSACCLSTIDPHVTIRRIQSWLLNFMTKLVHASFEHGDTAFDIWEAAWKTCIVTHNSSWLFQLQRQSILTCQNGESVKVFYEKLHAIWREIDCLCPKEFSCVDDGARRLKEIEADRLYDFLGGLDPLYDGLCSRILALSPVPPLLEPMSWSWRKIPVNPLCLEEVQ